MEIIKLRDEYIKLGQALKAANLVEDGVEAKLVIQDGLVKVNNEVDIRRDENYTTEMWFLLTDRNCGLKNKKYVH